MNSSLKGFINYRSPIFTQLSLRTKTISNSYIKPNDNIDNKYNFNASFKGKQFSLLKLLRRCKEVENNSAKIKTENEQCNVKNDYLDIVKNIKSSKFPTSGKVIYIRNRDNSTMKNIGKSRIRNKFNLSYDEKDRKSNNCNKTNLPSYLKLSRSSKIIVIRQLCNNCDMPSSADKC